MIDIRVPEAGESITQVELAKWLVTDGDYVEKDQEIAEIDSDKATLTINAQDGGIIKIIIDEGSTIEPGRVIGQIDTSAKKEASGNKKSESAPVEASPEIKKESVSAAEPVEKTVPEPESVSEKAADDQQKDFVLTPQAERLLDEMGIDAARANPNSKRITRKDVLAAIAGKVKDNDQDKGTAGAGSEISVNWQGSRNSERIKMTTLRRKISERLVAVKNETAMLTTFNEVDMSAIMDLRNRYKEQFFKKHGVKPGFMSFFAKAVTLALKSFPQVNGQIDEGYIVIPDYVDIGIAVSTPKGLMVPVIRDAQAKGIWELEKEIGIMAAKARDNKITIEELTGGTFSITNGGVFGSMLSTPIINPPQSAILGMHNIVDRPVAIKGKVEIRPIMYLALSYDHRVIDGKESVSFLVKVKEYLENPLSMLFQDKNPEELLLDI
jgi:2-oxoglutarate dehydrogenase E2 component (dihydrolipoamide succinyltransferase)